MTEPFFSIIIPTYNNENEIEGCVYSILKQSYNNFEIIIIDNKSKDLTLHRIIDLDVQRFVIVSESDNGVYDAMNKGIKKARGEWFFFLGSDDALYSENVLETIYNITINTDKKIIYGNVRINGDAGWAKDQDIHDGEFTLDKILRKNICHQAIFYSKNVFKSLGHFNTKYEVCADWDFNLKCFSKFNFHFEDFVVANFRGGGKSKLIEDIVFERDKWNNIFKYFRWKICKKEFRQFYEQFSIYKDKKHRGGTYFLIILFLRIRACCKRLS